MSCSKIASSRLQIIFQILFNECSSFSISDVFCFDIDIFKDFQIKAWSFKYADLLF